MKGIAFWFLVVAVVSVLIGMAWGIYMAASHDHTMAPVHAHLNLLGWVSFAIFAFYYHLVPAAQAGLLPRLHLALSLGGLVLIVPGIAMSVTGQGDTVGAVGSVLSVLGMACFMGVVIRSSLFAADEQPRAEHA